MHSHTISSTTLRLNLWLRYISRRTRIRKILYSNTNGLFVEGRIRRSESQHYVREVGKIRGSCQGLYSLLLHRLGWPVLWQECLWVDKDLYFFWFWRSWLCPQHIVKNVKVLLYLRVGRCSPCQSQKVFVFLYICGKMFVLQILKSVYIFYLCEGAGHANPKKCMYFCIFIHLFFIFVGRCLYCKSPEVFIFLYLSEGARTANPKKCLYFCVFIQGVFFNWCPPKSSKCQIT